jgi:hypothetical protein
MSGLLARRFRRRTTEGGNAIVVVLLVVATMSGLGITATVMAVANSQNADRDRQGAIAQDVADAGVAAGIEFLRSGANGISCPESGLTYNGTTWTSATTCSGAWNGPANAQTVTAGGQRYAVFISRVAKAAPPTTRESVYRIRSKGTTSTATAGVRQVEATIVARPFTYPVGVYADSVVAAGTADVTNETVFSSGCIAGLKHAGVTGTDVWYGGKAAIKTTGGATESNGSCTANNDVLSNANSGGTQCYGFGNTEYPVSTPYGGPQATPASCYNLPTTKFTISDLQDSFGLTARGLQPQQYAALKAVAKSQGNYYTTSSYTTPNGATYPNTVLYFKLSPGDEVNLNDIVGYSATTCGARSIVVVIDGGDARINSGADIVGALFVPDGTLRGNGGSTFTGTVFAKTLDKFNGTAEIRLDPCWADNFPLLNEFRVSDYRQVDR